MSKPSRTSIDDLMVGGHELSEDHLSLVAGGRSARKSYDKKGNYIGEDGCTDPHGTLGGPSLAIGTVLKAL